MRIRILAIGQKMPSWVNEGFTEYAKRLIGDCTLELIELPMSKRGKNNNIDQLKAKEAKSIEAALKKDELLVALDVLGKDVTTPQLAGLLSEWQMQGDNVAIVIGGPDGICQSLLDKANKKISLSKLTLPHPMVRVLLSEQLYRAWSINKGHPYHR